MTYLEKWERERGGWLKRAFGPQDWNAHGALYVGLGIGLVCAVLGLSFGQAIVWLAAP